MGTISPAECAIRAFGGVRKTANAIGRSPGAVSLWRRNGWVPSEIQAAVLRAAQAAELDLCANDLVVGRTSDPNNA
jgi:hypothetical protein